MNPAETGLEVRHIRSKTNFYVRHDLAFLTDTKMLHLLNDKVFDF